MRPSPFHKGSGGAVAPAAAKKPAQAKKQAKKAESSEDEVRRLSFPPSRELRPLQASVHVVFQ